MGNKREIKQNFFFYPWVQVVEGAKNSCLYDLKREIIFVLKEKKENPLLLKEEGFGSYLNVDLDFPDLFTSILKFELEEKITLILMEEVIELVRKIPIDLIERIFVFRKRKKRGKMELGLNGLLREKIINLLYNPRKCPFFRKPFEFDITYFFFKKYNPCWGLTISVDEKGMVKPCLWSHIIVGDLYKEDFHEILKRIEKYWKISKDMIEKCKDCEFRYACFDCRVKTFRETGNLFSGPPYCKYNPYNGKWEGRTI